MKLPDQASVLELRVMWSPLSLPLLSGPLGLGVAVLGQKELFNHLRYLKPFNCVQIELFALDRNIWNHLTVSKQMSFGSFRNYTNKLFVFKSSIYLYLYLYIYIYIYMCVCVCVCVCENEWIHKRTF